MVSPLRFLRKLLRPVKSRPETEIADKRLAFSIQNPSIEPSYKTTPKQVKMSISRKAQGFLKIFCFQHEALTVRRPKHPTLASCYKIFLYENFSRLVPRDSTLGHHILLQLHNKNSRFVAGQVSASSTILNLICMACEKRVTANTEATTVCLC